MKTFIFLLDTLFIFYYHNQNFKKIERYWIVYYVAFNNKYDEWYDVQNDDADVYTNDEGQWISRLQIERTIKSPSSK